MSFIKEIYSREIIDSRGNPTVETDIILSDNSFGRASVPSGASTGKHEAVELRDKNDKRYFGKGVRNAVYNIKKIISPKILNINFDSIYDFDQSIIEIDGTSNKSKMGSNAILSLSLAFAKALSVSNNTPLYEFNSQKENFILPVPMMNIINGGSHADNKVDIQEFMIAPVGANSFSEAIQYGAEILYCLKSKLKQKGLNTNVGDEGGFAPDINSSNEIIEYILSSIDKAGFKPGKEIVLALDIASTEFYNNSYYNMKNEGKKLSSEEMVVFLKDLVDSYPIYSIEDGLSEDDWSGWRDLTSEIGNKVQLVGDDLFATNIDRLKKGIDNKSANSILIKFNQIGTLSETFSTIDLAKKNNYTYIISHRSGETEDTTISDLAVSTASGQIKTGSLNRTDRISKYNQLLRIEEKLGNRAKYAGNSILKY